MHEVRRMIATLCEIFMSKLYSIKSLVYASMIARAFNRVAGHLRDRSLFSGGGGPLYLGGGSLFFELHLGEGHYL